MYWYHWVFLALGIIIVFLLLWIAIDLDAFIHVWAEEKCND